MREEKLISVNYSSLSLGKSFHLWAELLPQPVIMIREKLWLWIQRLKDPNILPYCTYVKLFEDGVFFYPWKHDPHGVCPIFQEGNLHSIHVIGKFLDVCLQLRKGCERKKNIKTNHHRRKDWRSGRKAERTLFAL